MKTLKLTYLFFFQFCLVPCSCIKVLELIMIANVNILKRWKKQKLYFN